MIPDLSDKSPIVAPSLNGAGKPAHESTFPSLLKRRRWTVIIVAFLVFGMAMVLTWRQTRLYASTATVLVEPPLGDSAQTSSTAPNMATEKRVAESAAVASLAANRLHTAVPLPQLLANLSVQVPVDTEILEFTYLSPSARDAQLRAEAFAGAYLEFRRVEATNELSALRDSVQARIQLLTDRLSVLNEMEQKALTSDARAQVRAEETSIIAQIGILQQKLADLTPVENAVQGRIVQDAALPQGPARPNVALNAFLGLLAGIMLGLGGAFAQEYADDRIRGAKDLETRLGVPVLAAMSPIRLSGPPPEHLISMYEPESPEAERFRQLRTNFVFASLQKLASSILVTSAREEEGKTFVAANLSVALAKAGKRVILVSADLRRPHLEDIFQAPLAPGLVDVLLKHLDWGKAVLATGVPNLSLLPSGERPSNPTELVGSTSMAELIEDMTNRADYVIVDTGPLLPVADASAIVPHCHAVLFVASAKKATRGNIARSREQLARLDATVLGAMLLDAPEGEISPTYPYAGGRLASRGLRLLSRGVR